MLKYGFERTDQREIHAAGGLERPRSRHTVSEARESMRAAMRKQVSGRPCRNGAGLRPAALL